MESNTHKRIKAKLAGKKGVTEKKIPGNRRLDVKKGNLAIEIEKSGNIEKAISRLKTQKSSKKKLVVPNKDLSKAVEIAKKKKLKAIITNLSGTTRRRT